MAMDSPEYGSARMRRDIGKSFLLGPLRLVVPTLGYLALYPLLLHRYGAEVLGLWALISVLSAAVAVADIGFSQLLRREVDPGAEQSELSERRADHAAAQWLYLLMGGVGTLAVLLAAPAISRAVVDVYPAPALVGSLLVLLGASVLQLVLQLDDAVLSAFQDAAYTHGVRAATPVLMIGGALGGALTGFPIEGFSGGTLLANAVGLGLLRRRLRRRHVQWTTATSRQPAGAKPKRMLQVARRGWHFYTIAVGTLVREPLARVILASVLGLAAVAVWDVAMKVTRVARDSVTAGLTVLYPSLAFLSRARHHPEMVRLMQLTLILVATIGGSSLGLVIAAAGFALPSIFPALGVEAIGTTQVLAVWNFVTLLNVPFWYALQATGFERHASWALWTHTISLVLVIPLSPLLSATVVDIAIYWTASALLTQALIFRHVHRRLGLLWPVLKGRSVRVALATSMAMVAGAWLIPQTTALLERSGVPRTPATVAYVVVLFGACAAVLWRHSWQPVAQFIAEVRAPVTRRRP